MRKWYSTFAVFAALVVTVGTAQAAAHRWGLKEGTPEMKSAGQLAFGPDGVLFVGDAVGANLFAIDTGDATAADKKPARTIEDLSGQLSKLTGKDVVTLNDLAVNPASGNIYLSLSVGADKTPAIAKIDGEGKLSLVSLTDVPFLKATISNPPEDKVVGEGRRARNRRLEAITDLAFTDGKVLVSGYANDDAPSKIREFPFPFADRETGTSVEIYHGNHGRLENNSTVRTFIPMSIDGKPALLAGFTCTPLVRFSLDKVAAGGTARGTTVAELGNQNTPLDMIAYKQKDAMYVLMSNSARGVMKISTKDIGREEGIDAPVRTNNGLAGQSYETVSDLAGTVQMDRLDDEHLVVVKQQDNKLSLSTVALP